MAGVGMRGLAFMAFALLLFSAAHANHHPGDTIQMQPPKPVSPIWSVVAALLALGLAYAIWKAYSYHKKLNR